MLLRLRSDVIKRSCGHGTLYTALIVSTGKAKLALYSFLGTSVYDSKPMYQFTFIAKILIFFFIQGLIASKEEY